MQQAILECKLQFTRTFLSSDSVLARKSELKRVRRERHFMSKMSCKAAESIEDAILRMARVNSNECKKGTVYYEENF